jgi:2-polyprenyl-3-methyl-5-hydroxy-6-metoxy-1,4-benzoquinol methylase
VQIILFEAFLREIDCHICSSRKYRVFGRSGRNRTVICRECGLFYTNPIPKRSDLISYVQNSTHYTQDQLSKVSFFRRRALTLFSRVERIIPPGRVLDIGCSIGTELMVARERGWDCTGIELSESSATIAKNQGLKIIQADVESCGLPNDSFDMITVNHVLEHISDLQSFFHEVSRILCLNGFLFISVPNVRAWQFYLRGQGYSWTFHADHFIHFSTNTLALLLGKYGFKIIDLYTSRWRDFHDDPKSHSFSFKIINNVIEKLGLGIEIFCLAQKG